MAITVQPITPDFAAEVGDVDLGGPLAADDLAAIRAAFTKYAVLVFPDQTFDDESHLDFARHFGPLETTVFATRKDHKLRLHANMADVGNLDAENRILTPTTACGSTSSATGCGTPIPRSSACRPTARSCMAARSRRSAARPSSPTCARPTTRCPRRRSGGSPAWWPSIR